MYSLLSRHVAIFLLFALSLQSCAPYGQLPYSSRIKVPLSADAKEYVALVSSNARPDGNHKPDTQLTYTGDPWLPLPSPPALINPFEANTNALQVNGIGGANEEKQAEISRADTLLAKSSPSDDPTIATHGLHTDRYWYSIADGMRLNLAIRQNLLDYGQLPTKEGEPYAALRENNDRIFLADPYHIDNFVSSLQDDMHMLLSRWQKMPTTLLIPFLGGMHWRIVGVTINYKDKNVKIWLDDPYGSNHFPASMREIIVDLIAKEANKLIQKQTCNANLELPKEAVRQSEKGLDQQGSGSNDWDCGPIVFSNLADYIQAIKEEKQAVSYRIGSYQEKNHREQLLEARKNHYLAYCKVQGFPINTGKLEYFKNYFGKLAQTKLKQHTNAITATHPKLLAAIYALSANELEIFFTMLENKRIAEKRELGIPYSQEELDYAYAYIVSGKENAKSTQALDKQVDLENALVHSVQAGLRNYYQHAFSHVKSWIKGGQAPLPIEKAQFHLLALRQQSLTASESAEELSRDIPSYKQRLAQVKEPIALVDLFKAKVSKPGQPPRQVQKVLLVGEPGTGKTTVSYQLAYLWSQGKGDQSLQTVYVLPIRALQHMHYDNHEHAKSDASLATAITNLYFPDIYGETAYTQLRAGVQATLQNPHTLVVLDGLDESKGVHEGLLNEAQQGKHKLLVLSRPYGLDKVRQDIELEVEHAGVSQNQIETYIQEYFSGQQHQGSALWQFVCNNAMLKNILATPANLDILCHVWNLDVEALSWHIQGGSITGLYNRMADYAWAHYLEKTAYKRRSFKEKLGDKEKSALFHALGCIALEALAGDEVVIREPTVSKVLENFSEKELLNKLFEDGSLSCFQRVDHGYQFAHSLWQEYFAGKALGSILLSENPLAQAQAQEFLQTYQYQSRYKMVLKFMAGTVSNINGWEGIRILLRSLRNSPQAILGIHQLAIELVCLNEYFATNPADPGSALEEEFHYIEQLRDWLAKAIEDMQKNGDDDQLFQSLSAMLCNMAAIVQTSDMYLDLLLKAAWHQNWYVRAIAIKSLGSLLQVAPRYARQVLIVLQRAAGDQNAYVRNATLDAYKAVLAVDASHAEAVLQSILNIINNERQPVPKAALDSLELLVGIVAGPQFVPKLLRAASIGDNSCLRQVALRVLGSLTKIAPGYATAYATEILLSLLRATEDQDATIRHVALEGLIALVDFMPNFSLQSLVYLLMALKNQEETIRVDIIKALGSLVKVAPDCAEKILHVLFKTVEDEKQAVGVSSLQSLAALLEAVPSHAAKALPVLLKAAEEAKPSCALVRQAAITSLVSLVSVAPAYAEQVVPFILRTAEDKISFETREVTINTLFTVVEAAPAYTTKILLCLLRALGDKESAVRQAAKKTLASLVSVPSYVAQVLPLLLRAADGEVWGMRLAARSVLVQLVQANPSYAGSLLPYLIQAVEGPDEAIRETARETIVALVQVAPNQLPKMLPSLLQGTEDKDAGIREATIITLGALVKVAPGCGPQVFSYLLRAAECDDNSCVREAALLGLMVLVSVTPYYVAETFPVLLRLAEEQESTVCTSAIYSLGCLAQFNPDYAAEIVSFLLKTVEMNQASYHVCQAALRGLQCLVETVPAYMDHILTSLLGDPLVNQAWFIRKAVLKSLVGFLTVAPSYAPKVLTTFLEAAESDNNLYVQEAARNAIVALLAAVPSCADQALPFLLKATQAKSEAMRHVGIKGLIAILKQGTPAYVLKVLPDISNAIEDKDDEIREAVINALSECSLSNLMLFYLNTDNKAIIPFIVQKAYQTPLVVQENTSQDEEKLLMIYYPQGAQAQYEQISSNFRQKVRELIELLQITGESR